MKISVALCTYNGEKYIKRQLESILNQTVSVTEIIIIDDCSFDSTMMVVQKIEKQNPDVIKFFRNDTNLGFRGNFEKALTKCTGDYIFFSDQDDVWKENKVERIISFLKGNEMWGVFTNADLIDENGQKKEDTLFDGFGVRRYLCQDVLNPDLFTMLILNSNFVTGATLAITKEAKSLVLPFRTSKHIYHDHYIALKLAAINKFACLNECLISYRIHSSQQIGLGKNNTVKKSLFDMLQETVPNDISKMKFLCKFIIFRRLWSAEIAMTCQLNSEERRLQKKKYDELLMPLVKQMRLDIRCELMLRYLYREFQIRKLYRFF